MGIKAIGKYKTPVFLQHSGDGVGEKYQTMNHRIIVYIVLVALYPHCTNPTIVNKIKWLTSGRLRA